MIKIYITPVVVDGETAIQTRIALLALIQSGARKVVCDFSHTEVMSPSGVEAFANAGKLLRKIGGELGICWARPNIQALFAEGKLANGVRFYNVEESITICAIRELVKHFDLYEDVRDISTRREGNVTIIEIYLLFASDSTMGEVQQTMMLIGQDVEKQIQNSRVVIIANAYLDNQKQKNSSD